MLIGKIGKNIIYQMNSFTFEDFKSKLYDNISVKVNAVYALFNQKIDALKNQGEINTSSIYYNAKNSLKRFKSKLNIMDIYSHFLNIYKSYMLSEGKSLTIILPQNRATG